MPAFLAVLGVYLAVRAYWWIGSLRTPLLDPVWIEQGLLKLLLWVLPSVLMTMIATRRPASEAWRALGLVGSPGRGYFFGALAALPMAVVVLYGAKFSTTIDALVGGVVLGPFAEEVLFRGFLLLTLVRVAGWRFIPAMLVSALAFAMAHSHQAAGSFALGVVSLLFAPTNVLEWMFPEFWRATLSLAPFFGAGVLFAWLTLRWGSLWPAVGLHACINLWWELSPATLELASIGRMTLTPLPVAHAITVVLAVAMTWRATRGQVRQVQPVRQVRLV